MVALTSSEFGHAMTRVALWAGAVPITVSTAIHTVENTSEDPSIQKVANGFLSWPLAWHAGFFATDRVYHATRNLLVGPLPASVKTYSDRLEWTKAIGFERKEAFATRFSITVGAACALSLMLLPLLLQKAQKIAERNSRLLLAKAIANCAAILCLVNKVTACAMAIFGLIGAISIGHTGFIALYLSLTLINLGCWWQHCSSMLARIRCEGIKA